MTVAVAQSRRLILPTEPELYRGEQTSNARIQPYTSIEEYATLKRQPEYCSEFTRLLGRLNPLTQQEGSDSRRFAAVSDALVDLVRKPDFDLSFHRLSYLSSPLVQIVRLASHEPSVLSQPVTLYPLGSGFCSGPETEMRFLDMFRRRGYDASQLDLLKRLSDEVGAAQQRAAVPAWQSYDYIRSREMLALRLLEAAGDRGFNLSDPCPTSRSYKYCLLLFCKNFLIADTLINLGLPLVQRAEKPLSSDTEKLIFRLSLAAEYDGEWSAAPRDAVERECFGDDYYLSADFMTDLESRFREAITRREDFTANRFVDGDIISYLTRLSPNLPQSLVLRLLTIADRGGYRFSEFRDKFGQDLLELLSHTIDGGRRPAYSVLRFLLDKGLDPQRNNCSFCATLEHNIEFATPRLSKLKPHEREIVKRDVEVCRHMLQICAEHAAAAA
jgi:hypothetical protein